jgi:peptide/nickel transport system substrate-binding protein
MLNNKTYVLLALITLVAMLLAACGAGTSVPSIPTATEAPVVASQVPAATPQATTAPSAAFLTVNMEQQATWVRNFNPFSPDARLQAAQGTIYEPMMIFNKATVSWFRGWLLNITGMPTIPL